MRQIITFSPKELGKKGLKIKRKFCDVIRMLGILCACMCTWAVGGGEKGKTINYLIKQKNFFAQNFLSRFLSRLVISPSPHLNERRVRGKFLR